MSLRMISADVSTALKIPIVHEYTSGCSHNQVIRGTDVPGGLSHSARLIVTGGGEGGGNSICI